MQLFIFSAEADYHKVFTVDAQDGQSGNHGDISYTQVKLIGNGSFGVVMQARLVEGGDQVAIKKVLQDRRFKVSL